MLCTVNVCSHFECSHFTICVSHSIRIAFTLSIDAIKLVSVGKSVPLMVSLFGELNRIARYHLKV